MTVLDELPIDGRSEVSVLTNDRVPNPGFRDAAKHQLSGNCSPKTTPLLQVPAAYGIELEEQSTERNTMGAGGSKTDASAGSKHVFARLVTAH